MLVCHIDRLFLLSYGLFDRGDFVVTALKRDVEKECVDYVPD
jgi:hypothetical protein